MNAEQVNKNIRQMRQVFGFFGILAAIGIPGVICQSIDSYDDPYALLCLAPMCVIFLLTTYELGRRSKSGYQLAQLSSIILLLGFPILTIFGISYLNKLSKPEMKQAFSGAPPGQLQN